MESGCRVIGQKRLKIAEGHGALVKVPGGSDHVKAHGVRDKLVHAVKSIPVPEIIFAFFCGNDLQGFPLRVTPGGLDFLSQKRGYVGDVLHELIHIAENFRIDLLENVFFPASVSLCLCQIGSVDVSVSVLAYVDDASFHCKLTDDFLLFHNFSSLRLRRV